MKSANEEGKKNHNIDEGESEKYHHLARSDNN